MPSSISDPRAQIRARALAEGFDVVRFARAQAPQSASDRLTRFLDEDRHGDMAWMASNKERRSDPATLWPEAKSIVVVGANYGPSGDPLVKLADRNRAAISVYALGDDYHEVMKKRLKKLATFVAETFAADVKVFVDTAPVMEKPLAQAAGIGWQGKHTNLVSREYGSWLFLGSLFTTLPIEEDQPESDHCGSCRQCLDICPTDAFPAPYELDARRCISYLTIEHKGHIPAEFRKAIANRIYGCDDCLAVCPWNKYAKVARLAQFHARAELDRARLEDLLQLDEATFRELFRGSPIKRIGRDRFVRNVLIAVGNSGERSLVVLVKTLLQDQSPLVRAMAVWALSQLLSPTEFTDLRLGHRHDEPDPDVTLEWSRPVA